MPAVSSVSEMLLLRLLSSFAMQKLNAVGHVFSVSVIVVVFVDSVQYFTVVHLVTVDGLMFTQFTHAQL